MSLRTFALMFVVQQACASSTLTISRLIESIAGEQPSIPYNVHDTFVLLNESSSLDDGLEGVIWINLTQIRHLSPFEAEYFAAKKDDDRLVMIPTNPRRYAMNDSQFFDVINQPGSCGRMYGYMVCVFQFTIIDRAYEKEFQTNGALVAFDCDRRVFGAYVSTLVAFDDCGHRKIDIYFPMHYETIDDFGFADVAWNQKTLSAKNAARYHYDYLINPTHRIQDIHQIKGRIRGD
jgi:hypothetical protein